MTQSPNARCCRRLQSRDMSTISCSTLLSRWVLGTSTSSCSHMHVDGTPWKVRPSGRNCSHLQRPEVPSTLRSSKWERSTEKLTTRWLGRCCWPWEFGLRCHEFSCFAYDSSCIVQRRHPWVKRWTPLHVTRRSKVLHKHVWRSVIPVSFSGVCPEEARRILQILDIECPRHRDASKSREMDARDWGGHRKKHHLFECIPQREKLCALNPRRASINITPLRRNSV